MRVQSLTGRLLEELECSGNVSQRALAARLGIGVGAVNRHIRSLLRQGYVEVVDSAVRPFAYRLTPAGMEYRRKIRHSEYESAVGSYREVERRIEQRLAALKAKGVERVVFYGAGAVMEVGLPIARRLGLRVVGVVDDDPAKQGKKVLGTEVLAPSVVQACAPDALVIATFRYAQELTSRLRAALDTEVLVWEL